MALVDDPPDFIRTMFRKAAVGDDARHCTVFRDGDVIAGLPLEAGERVYGVFKGKYHFTPASLIVVEKGALQQVRWREIISCSTKHGEGASKSIVRTVGGQEITVRLRELGPAWGGLSQLYHGMIARWGVQPAFGEVLMELDAFFREAGSDDEAFAPNAFPERTLTFFKEQFAELERRADVAAVLVVPRNRDVEQSLSADELVVVTDTPPESFEPFARVVGADSVSVAAEELRRRLPTAFRNRAALYFWWD